MEAFMKSRKNIFLIIVVIFTVLSLLLSACGPIDESNGNSEKDKTKGNGNDKDKENGKDKEKDSAGNANKITICHGTGSAKNPYVEITISVNATSDGHGTHEGDLIPAPVGGCPDAVITDDVPAK
jgi:hypothetical protein